MTRTVRVTTDQKDTTSDYAADTFLVDEAGYLRLGSGGAPVAVYAVGAWLSAADKDGLR